MAKLKKLVFILILAIISVCWVWAITLSEQYKTTLPFFLMFYTTTFIVVVWSLKQI